MKATLNNLRMSPRKVRLVVNAVRGKSLVSARGALSFMPRAAALPVRKLLESAARNAGGGESLQIAEARVDAGPILKRHMPRARGSAYLIRKRTSTVTLVLKKV
jgi:large subunit ribosomal protein L22